MTFHLAISIPATGGPPALVPRLGNSSFLKSSFPNFLQISENRTSGTRSKSMRSSSIRSTGLLDAVISHSSQSTPPNEATYPQMDDEYRSLWNLLFDFPEKSHILSGYLHRVVIADIDPATAKLAIGILGPVLSAFSFLFIVRIVMSWYPKLPVGKFPYVLAYAPTEPLLIPTRKVIPPLGGVDVTPVVWFGLISFLNEILVGPQGLLVLLSQQA